MVKQSGLYEPLSEQAIVGRVNGEWESINWSSSKYVSAVVGERLLPSKKDELRHWAHKR